MFVCYSFLGVRQHQIFLHRLFDLINLNFFNTVFISNILSQDSLNQPTDN